MMKVKKLFVFASLLALVAMTLTACGPSNSKLSTSCSPEAGGTISPSSGTYDKGVEVDVTASPASGYRFDHWEGSASGKSPTLHLVMDGKKHLTAYFVKTYTLSASCTPSDSGSVSPDGGTYDEGSQVTLIATPAQYYVFSGWGEDASGSSDHLTITMDSSKTIVASFSKIAYGLETQVDPSGSGSVNPSEGTFEAGSYETITATPENGYRFDHWSSGASGTSSTVSILMDSNKTLTAHFTKVCSLTISCAPTSGGTVSISPSSGVYDEGSQVILVATPAQYHTFSGWSGDASGTSDHLILTMDSNKTIVASFTKITCNLSTQVDPSDGGTIDPSSGTFDAGTQKTITGTPASGYIFDHWGGDATGTLNPVSILIDSNKTVIAYFTRVYTLSVSSSPNGSCTINPSSGNYDAGTIVNLTATALFTYAFDHWSGTDDDNANPTTVGMTSDKSVTAYFIQLSPGTQQNQSSTYGGAETRFPIVLSAGQWVQGSISSTWYAVPVRILDPVFNVVQDLGTVQNTTGFTFQAQASGTYYIDVPYTWQFSQTTIHVTYTIYS